MRLLFVTKLDPYANKVYATKWRSNVKLLFVSQMDRYMRAVRTITKYVQVGKDLGHEVAVFGEQSSDFPSVPHSLDTNRFDFAIFAIYETSDFPDLPYLARLLDGMPKERRVIIDCVGRYNETIRVEHDFNHLEKLDSHQGWEWIEGFQAVSDKILQPTLTPLRDDVHSFLFHGYDQASVARSYSSPDEAAQAWSRRNGAGKPYGLAYVGNNWQRWTQLRRFLKAIEPLQAELGSIRLGGWDWDKRPDWAAELDLVGVDVDAALLDRLGVERWGPIPFDEVLEFVGQARFAPVIHRPLFKQLGLVTNRTFETFGADAIPLLMLPDDFVETIYGPDARLLAPGDNVIGRLNDMMHRPEVYWEAVLKTRAHLAEHHSYQQRFNELLAILAN